MKKAIENIKETKSWYFVKINKMGQMMRPETTDRT